MGQIWVTSDWHFCHNRSFLWEPRGFTNQYKMNDAIIERHNSIVNMDDDVYCLGDVCLNETDVGIACVKQLKGRIHIIRGNHDSDERIEALRNCYNVVEVCEGKYLKYCGYHFYLSHYPCLCSNYDIDKPLKKRTISLCGHSHTRDPFADFSKGLIYHCDQDAHNCYPVNINNIIQDIQEKIK